jgi:hypothetical protein
VNALDRLCVQLLSAALFYGPRDGLLVRERRRFTRKDWKAAAASTAIFAIVDFIVHITARLALCPHGFLNVLELLLPKMRPSCGHMTM